jgi:putative hydrolase of the HAD superfamily
MNVDAAALAYAPVILLDAREPFRPRRLGYTLLEHSQRSPSFLREIEIVPPAVQAIEYAIWWEWDISHLFDLEHVWVYLDAVGAVLACEGSYHGFYRELDVTLEEGHVVVLALPGKHGFGGSPEDFAAGKAETERACGPEAGRDGLLIPHLYLDRLRKDPHDDALIFAHLQRRSFVPAWQFMERIQPAAKQLCPWSELEAWMPGQVEACVARLRREEANNLNL